MSHDEILWSHRDYNYDKLAECFGRTNGGIRRRLQELSNPQSDAFERLFGVLNSHKYSKTHPFIEHYEILMCDDQDELAVALKKGSRWKLKEDLILWQNRDAPVRCLANYLDRTLGSIGSRLETLRNRHSEPRKNVQLVLGGNMTTSDELKAESKKGRNKSNTNATTTTKTKTKTKTRNSESDKENSGRLCLICEENEAVMVFVPCGHLVICKPCSKRLMKKNKKKCIVCRCRYESIIKTYS